MNYDDLRLEQLRIEKESDSLARASALAKLIEGAYDGDTELPRAQAVVKNMCGLVVQSLKEQAESKTRGVGARYKTWLRALPGNVAAVIAIRESIRMCTGPQGYGVRIQDLAYAVGKLWELEVRILQAEIVNKPYMQKIHDQVKERGTMNLQHLRKLYGVATERVFKGSIDLTLTKADMIQLGKFGVHACYEAGLLEVEHGTNKNGTSVAYRLAEDVEEFLKGYRAEDVRKVLAVDEMRMRCPPDPWTTIYDGGYLSAHRKVVAPLRSLAKTRQSLKGAVVSDFNAEKIPQVFSAANYLQSIAFEFHRPTVDAILKVWGEGGGVMGVPRANGPVKPEFPFSEEWVAEGAPPHEVERFQRWKRDAARYYEKRKKWKGHMMEVGSFMRSVQKDTHPFWFPVFFDDRGRWYYRGTPHPQGSDMAKGALHFHRKKPLGERGVFWLKVHIANSSGFDKERMRERAAWTESRWELLCEALDDPASHHEVWGTDNPWCAYSAAWELREAYRSGNPYTYETGIAVHMDATCSGLQHFSALLRDPVGAVYVNLTDPTGIGPKQDIYAKVSKEVLAMLEQDLQHQDVEVRTKAAWFLKLGITRNLAKTPVMTYVYGATLAGTAQFIEGFYEEEIMPLQDAQWPEDFSSFDMSMYLARKMFAGIERAVPAAAAAMRWLRAVVRAQPYGKPLVWSTPVGFQIVHDYREYDEVRVALRSCGVQRIIVRDWTDGTRTIPMQNAISPNFVHGLDATHLTMTANAMQSLGHDFVGIHDSFGTHPCDVDDLHRCIRSEFVHLYKRHNLFADFLWQVGGSMDVPERGDFNLDDVLTSEFMFS